MAKQATSKQSPQAKAAQTKAANKAKAVAAQNDVPTGPGNVAETDVAVGKTAPDPGAKDPTQGNPNGAPTEHDPTKEIDPKTVVFGNKDAERKFGFPYIERDYFHLKTSRSTDLPSGVNIEDPGSIRHQIYNQKQWEHTNHYDHMAIMGLNVEIMHDPTAKEPVQF